MNGTRIDPFANGNNLSESIFLKETKSGKCLQQERLAEWGEGGRTGLTYTVASASLQDTPSSLFGVVGKLVIFQKFGVSTQGEHLSEDESRKIKEKHGI